MEGFDTIGMYANSIPTTERSDLLYYYYLNDNPYAHAKENK